MVHFFDIFAGCLRIPDACIPDIREFTVFSEIVIVYESGSMKGSSVETVTRNVKCLFRGFLHLGSFKIMSYGIVLQAAANIDNKFPFLWRAYLIK
jgi:hypothetical protein